MLQAIPSNVREAFQPPYHGLRIAAVVRMSRPHRQYALRTQDARRFDAGQDFLMS
jgi:hypothetical protein